MFLVPFRTEFPQFFGRLIAKVRRARNKRTSTRHADWAAQYRCLALRPRTSRFKLFSTPRASLLLTSTNTFLKRNHQRGSSLRHERGAMTQYGISNRYWRYSKYYIESRGKIHLRTGISAEWGVHQSCPAKECVMKDQHSSRFTGEAVDLFENALREFHHGACSGAQQVANSSQIVTMEAMRQAVVKTCLAMADHYSTAESSGEKRVA